MIIPELSEVNDTVEVKAVEVVECDEAAELEFKEVSDTLCIGTCEGKFKYTCVNAEIIDDQRAEGFSVIVVNDRLFTIFPAAGSHAKRVWRQYWKYRQGRL